MAEAGGALAAPPAVPLGRLTPNAASAIMAESLGGTRNMIETHEHKDGWLRAGWIGLITAATVLGSFVFACATPFPALGALAALHLPRRDAFALVGANWLVNQIIGYGFLHYPTTWDSYAWGAAIGVSALVATAAAIGVDVALRRAPWALKAVGAFIAAFVVYELAIYAPVVMLPSETSAYSFDVVLYILEVNAIAFGALLVLQAIGRFAGLALPRAGRTVAA